MRFLGPRLLLAIAAIAWTFPTGAATVTLGSVTGECGGTSSVGVTVAEAGELVELEFVVSYDSTRLTFFSMAPGGVVEEEWYLDPRSEPGAVRVRMRPPTARAVSGPIGSLLFSLLPGSTVGEATLQVVSVTSQLVSGVVPGTGNAASIRFACLGRPLPLPGTPTLNAAAQSSSSVVLQWSEVQGANRYRIYRGESEIYDGPRARLVDANLASANEHCYRVRAVSETGVGPLSTQSCATTTASCIPPMSAPAVSVRAVGTAGAMVSWGEVPNAVSYRVRRDGTIVHEGTALELEDGGLSAAKEYCYTVQAASACGDSVESAPVCATTASSCTPLTAVPVLSALPVGSTTMSLGWNAVEGATEYKVDRGNLSIEVGSVTSFADTLLSPSTEYCYSIVALGPCGSLRSPETCLTTQPAEVQKLVVSHFAGSRTGPGISDGVGVVARFYFPRSLAIDSSGNLYVTDSFNHTVRKVTQAGVVTTIAGVGGKIGSADGVGVAARFNHPTGIAVDPTGNIYVTDSANSTIRKITPAGVVSTLAGTPGVTGSADGTGAAARFDRPEGITWSADGNLYVADTYNVTIRRVTPAGVVTTLAGLAGERGFDDGTGSAARFRRPRAITSDAAGDLRVADTSAHTIRKVTLSGIVTTIAGAPGELGSVDGTGADARFFSPSGVSVDAEGNVWVADSYYNDTIIGGNSTIRRISPDGQVTTVAGAPEQLGSADGPAVDARFSKPSGIVTDTEGNVWVGDTFNSTIRKISADLIVSTVAGAAGGLGSVDGSGAAALFNDPTDVAVDASGNVYVADRNNHLIRRVTPSGFVSTVAGLARVEGSEDGVGQDARFRFPRSIAIDPEGNVIIADRNNYIVRKMTPSGVVSTIAGMAGQKGDRDGVGTDARFDWPVGVAVDKGGMIYVADYYNATIRRITPDGVVTTLAGSGGNPGSADGTGSAARFDRPRGVAVDLSGNVWVADYGNHTIRRVTPAGVVTTVAGLPGVPGSADGTGSSALFNLPFDVWVDPEGNVLVADTYNFTIRKVTPAGEVTTIAGVAGLVGTEDGEAAAARFVFPQGVVADASGAIYVADSVAVRRGTPCASGILCLDGSGFEVSLLAKDPRKGDTGAGLPIPENDVFGFFSLPDLTGNPDNPEVFVKLLDGRPINGSHWVFYGGLTDLEYAIAVTDRRTGAVKTYRKEPFAFCGGADTSAFADSGQARRSSTLTNQVQSSVRELAAGSCGAMDLCFSDGRFGARLSAKDPRSGNVGTGLPIPQTDLFGYFALPALTGNPDNPEVFVKILDGRPINGRFWVFYGGLTDLEYTLTVTDHETGNVETYNKEPFTFCGGADTGSF